MITFTIPAGLTGEGEIHALCATPGCCRMFGPFASWADARAGGDRCPDCLDMENDLLQFCTEGSHEFRKK